ncbi:hypothetical protein QQS21_000789 [Conoideocrella luteorostrata]|uniref:Uncharacterized protein n=1 Tax=Conoideocrella luteorostrata TaxID=1105319 RepID=A0AAJ0FYZ9_9HYPO|nr:hypothetical protein QQS21_000789 [Conoideocrella luteorostrata]
MTTPSYYPPGWDRERWKTATEQDFAKLTDDDFEKFHTGIRAHLGEDGAEAFFDEIHQYQLQLKAYQPQPESNVNPNFVLSLNQLRDDDGGFREWGFVVYRTAGYDDDETLKHVKSTIEAKINKQFDQAQRARDKFSLMWMEGGELAGKTPEEIGRIYSELFFTRDVKGLFGFAHYVCLCVDESSIKSIRDAPPELAHVLAISTSCGDPDVHSDEAEDERWTGSFKVAIDSLIEPLFTLVGDDSLTAYEIGVGVTPDLLWTDYSRFGKKKAFVE